MIWVIYFNERVADFHINDKICGQIFISNEYFIRSYQQIFMFRFNFSFFSAL